MNRRFLLSGVGMFALAGCTRPSSTAYVEARTAPPSAVETQAIVDGLPPPRQLAPVPAPVQPVVARENIWVRVGANAFDGDFQTGLPLLGLAPSVVSAFLDQVARRAGATGAMPDGVLYAAQVYTVNGAHKVWRNVRQKLGRPLRGVLYSVTVRGVRYYVFYPPKETGGCNNLSLMTAAVEANKFVRD